MSSSEFVRLTRRVDAHDETLQALSDTVFDIKETVDRHTQTLDSHTQTLDGHGEMLVEILRRLEPRPHS
ncbi:MAG: hypothetical protein M3Z25_18840 [Actinomycetota bacterium]|nr:hypothetical protein [Actinomycetota bacterium]